MRSLDSVLLITSKRTYNFIAKDNVIVMQGEQVAYKAKLLACLSAIIQII